MAAGLLVLTAGHAIGTAAAPAERLAGQAPPQPVASPDRAWSAARPLTWAEFRGTAPAGGMEGARTVYLLRYESRCHGKTFTFDVKAVFVPDESWVKADVLASPRESVRVLQHEQTHFDLTEVHARRMRKYFAGLYDACGLSDAQVDAAVDRFVKEEAAAQQRYDDETGYGLVPARQRVWTERVAEMLTSLEAFTRP